MSKEQQHTTTKSNLRHARAHYLECAACGNKDYFVEVMSYESHLVTADLTYVRLIVGVPDHYECYECGELISYDPYEIGPENNK